jgi:hypothetical protein
VTLLAAAVAVNRIQRSVALNRAAQSAGISVVSKFIARVIAAIAVAAPLQSKGIGIIRLASSVAVAQRRIVALVRFIAAIPGRIFRVELAPMLLQVQLEQRIFFASAELRMLAVLPEIRTVHVEGEERMFAGAEARTRAVLPEIRMVRVEGEERIFTAMSVANVTKDPRAKLEYGFDWTEWLAGNTITASDWTVESGITKESEAFSSTVATVMLSGGTVGKTYHVTNLITCIDGQKDERTLRITIRNK